MTQQALDKLMEASLRLRWSLHDMKSELPEDVHAKILELKEVQDAILKLK